MKLFLLFFSSILSDEVIHAMVKSVLTEHDKWDNRELRENVIEDDKYLSNEKCNIVIENRYNKEIHIVDYNKAQLHSDQITVIGYWNNHFIKKAFEQWLKKNEENEKSRARKNDKKIETKLLAKVKGLEEL